jgi:hypothetical protein
MVYEVKRFVKDRAGDKKSRVWSARLLQKEKLCSVYTIKKPWAPLRISATMDLGTSIIL